MLSIFFFCFGAIIDLSAVFFSALGFLPLLVIFILSLLSKAISTIVAIILCKLIRREYIEIFGEKPVLTKKTKLIIFAYFIIAICIFLFSMLLLIFNNARVNGCAFLLVLFWVFLGLSFIGFSPMSIFRERETLILKNLKEKENEK